MKMKIRNVLLGAQVVGQASVIALQRTTCRTEKITASVCAAVVFPLVKQLVLCRFRWYDNHLCSISGSQGVMHCPTFHLVEISWATPKVLVEWKGPGVTSGHLNYRHLLWRERNLNVNKKYLKCEYMKLFKEKANRNLRNNWSSSNQD